MNIYLKHEIPMKIKKLANALLIGTIICMVFLLFISIILFISGNEEVGFYMIISTPGVWFVGYLQKVLLYGFAILVDNSMNAEERAERIGCSTEEMKTEKKNDMALCETPEKNNCEEIATVEMVEHENNIYLGSQEESFDTEEESELSQNKSEKVTKFEAILFIATMLILCCIVIYFYCLVF